MGAQNFKEKYFGVDGLLLVMGAATVAGALFYFVKDDGLGRGRHEKANAVGKFTASRNDVRRRIQSGFTWSATADQEVVYEGDSVFTGDNSDATIQLDGGSRIEIDPKSLVVVHTRGRGLQLELQYGSLVGKVQGAAPLVVSQNGQLQEISSKDAEVRIETSVPEKKGAVPELRVRVVRGEISLRKISAPGRTARNAAPAPAQIIKQNEVARVAMQVPAPNSPPAPVVIIEQEPIEPLAPANGAVLWLSPGQPLDFRWKAPSNLAKSRVEFASDPTFTTVTRRLDVAGSSLRLPTENRPVGPFQWRVVPLEVASSPNVSGKLEPSRPSKLTIYPDSPPLPIFPVEGQEFSFNTRAGESGKEVLFSWEDGAGSSEYELQLGNDDAFSKFVVSKKLKVPTDRSVALSVGTYYWRVQGTHPARKSPPWSRTMRFAVTEELRAPEAPTLAATALTYEIPMTVLAKAPPGVSLGGRGVAATDVPSFRWSEPALADSYEVELANNDQFANSLKYSTGKETKFAPGELKPGEIKVRVRAKGKTGLLSPPSTTGVLTVTLPAPRLEPVKSQTTRYATPAELEKGKHAFDLKWSELPFASTYEVNWGADVDFSQSKKFKLKESTRAIQVTRAATYAARVRAIGPDGEPMSPYSATETAVFKKELLAAIAPVTVAPPKPPIPPVAAIPPPSAGPRKPSSLGGMAAPLLVEPLRATSFVSLDDSVPFVNLKWKKVSGAEAYEVELAEDADFTKPVEKFKTMKTQFTVKANLPEGRVFWRVRALGRKPSVSSDWSGVYDINVLYQ